MKLNDYTAHELSDKLSSGEVTSEELVKAYYERIGEKDELVKAYVSTIEEKALKKARSVDEKRKNRRESK